MFNVREVISLKGKSIICILLFVRLLLRRKLEFFSVQFWHNPIFLISMVVVQSFLGRDLLTCENIIQTIFNVDEAFRAMSHDIYLVTFLLVQTDISPKILIF